MFLPTAKRKATGDGQQSDPLVTETNSATATATEEIECSDHSDKCETTCSEMVAPDSNEPEITPAAAIKDCDSDLYPNIRVLLQVACTLPVTSCECERRASALRRLQNYTRASMRMSRLSSLALLHIHYDMHVNLDEVVTRYAHLHPRKLELDSIIRP